MKQSLHSLGMGLIGGFIGTYLYFLVNPINNQTLIQHVSQNDSSYRLTNFSSSVDSHYYSKTAERVSNNTTTFAKASEIGTKSVVYIRNISQSSYQPLTWFDFFFRGGTTEEQVIGSGSGVIVTEDGFIVTNKHVIKDAHRVEVVYNKRVYVAEVIGTDSSTDLAVIKINAQKLPAIPVASSQSVQVGDWVLAIGNPFNLTSTVTAGIVSAKGRRINILQDVFPIESFIQTDAAINPGNSGGALVNTKGELVGINTAIISKTGSYAGYGFAVPSDIVLKIFHDIKSYGEVQKAFLGVSVIDIDEKISEKLQTDDLSGVFVNEIEKGGAAEKADIHVGDVIVKIDDKIIESQSTYDEILSYHSPGDYITITLRRSGKLLEKKVQLTNIDGTTSITKRMVYDAKELGASLEIVPKLEKSKLGIESGIRIKEVRRGGLIQRMGLEEGDIIIAINRYKVEKPEEFIEIMEKIRGRVILAVLTRDGRQTYYSYHF